jgi:hypothetical protein
MDLLNFTRFAADRFIGMGGDGFEHLLVVVKATFGITRNGLSLLDEQPPIPTADEYHGDPATSSIAAAAETAPFGEEPLPTVAPRIRLQCDLQ